MLLAQLAGRVPTIAVRTVADRWVLCSVHAAGFHTSAYGATVSVWHAHPVDPDLRRSEITQVWDDMPPWLIGIALVQMACEEASG